jgi:hypothetical protein
MPAPMLPAPVGGWNAKDSLAAMPPSDAIRLINVFPDIGNATVRRGFTEFVDFGNSDVESLVEYSDQQGSRILAGFCDNTFHSATTGGAVTAHSGTYSNNKFLYANFKNFLVGVNGVDTPFTFNGTTKADTSFTGVTQENIAHLFVHKQRLFFIEKDSMSLWYPGVGEVTGGTCTEYDISTFTRRGGYLLAGATWTRDGGDGPDDYVTLVTNMGEVLIFGGDYPGGTWAMVGRYDLPQPIGRKCLTQFGGEIAIITEQGMLPLGQVLSGRAPGQYIYMSDKIQDAFVKFSRDYSTNFGWEAIVYGQGKMGIVNVPVGSGTFIQCVVNLITGAWCKFEGMNASCWSLLDGGLYFGGSNGKVYKADTGQNDNGSAIPIDIKWAFNYLGSPSQRKGVTMIKPYLLTDASSIQLEVSADVDFGEKRTASIVTTSETTGTSWGSAWGSPWSGSNRVISKWYTTRANGFSIAPKLRAQLKNQAFAINSLQINFVRGGKI